MNFAPWALRNGEGIRGSIDILILNTFEYGTHDPIIQSIHIHS